jgi:hypothetical protein
MSDASRELLLEDSFERGFDLGGPGHTWGLLSLGDFTADDADASAGAEGLLVRAKGMNPETGEPAFVKALPVSLNNLRWMAIANRVSSSSLPGFDAALDRELRCAMTARGRTFGTDAHPFGDAVSDPQSDMRLAAYGMNTIDFETGMAFNHVATNTAIYPLYECVPMGQAGPFQAFMQIFPGVPRLPDDVDTLAVSYDRGAGIVRWLVNGDEAARVDRIGFPSPDATIILDHGGSPALAEPRQLVCGMALYQLLDGGLPPSNRGLVDLGAAPYLYPESFVFATAGEADNPYVFGQGAQLEVKRYEVVSVESGSPDVP